MLLILSASFFAGKFWSYMQVVMTLVVVLFYQFASVANSDIGARFGSLQRKLEGKISLRSVVKG